MTAVDHAARIAEVVSHLLETDALTGNDEGTPDRYSVHCDDLPYLVKTVIAGLKAAGVLPEVEVTEEWGVRWPDGEITSCGWLPPHSEQWARRALHSNERIINGRIGETVMRRDRTRYAEHVTEWEAVD